MKIGILNSTSILSTAATIATSSSLKHSSPSLTELSVPPTYSSYHITTPLATVEHNYRSSHHSSSPRHLSRLKRNGNVDKSTLKPSSTPKTSETRQSLTDNSETITQWNPLTNVTAVPMAAAGPNKEQTVVLSLELSVCPEDVYTEEQVAYRVYANMPIGIFGILANILNVMVFCDSEMRTLLVNHFLLVLSISDLFLLLCNFFFLVLPVIVVDTNSFFLNDLFPVIIRYSYPLALTAQTSGVYLTVLVSVHRFLGVCYPFRAKRWVTKKPVKYAIIASVLFSILSNIPTWLELSVMACYSQRFNRISRKIALAPFHDMTYILIKKTVVYTFVMFCVPFTILITVNWRIIIALKESSHLRTMHTYSTKGSEYQNDNPMKQFHLLKNSKYSEIFHTFSKLSNATVFRPTADIFKTKFTNSTRDRSVTLMLLAIVALFLFCNGLAFCNSIVESIMLVRGAGIGEDEALASDGTVPAVSAEAAAAEATRMEELIKMFECSVEISNVLITLNSATSALVYLIFSSKYRIVAKSILRLQKRKKINRVAVTTALAAHRAVELSLIPEEADNRKRIEEQQVQQLQQLSNYNRRGRLFRSQTSATSACAMTHSESNLRLMENEDNFVSIEEKAQ